MAELIQTKLGYYYDNIKAMYETLTLGYHLDPGNIYILYADGGGSGDRNISTSADPEDHPVYGDSDMSFAAGAHVLSATSGNLQTTLQDLAKVVTTNDHFFFYSFDHGGGTTDKPDIKQQGSAWRVGELHHLGHYLWQDTIHDYDLASWLKNVKAGYDTYVFTECFSGGMIDDLGTLAPNQFACAATNSYEESFGDGFAGEFVAALKTGDDFTQDAYRFAFDNDPSAAHNEQYAPNEGTFDQVGKDTSKWNEHPFSEGKSILDLL